MPCSVCYHATTEQDIALWLCKGAIGDTPHCIVGTNLPIEFQDSVGNMWEFQCRACRLSLELLDIIRENAQVRPTLVNSLISVHQNLALYNYTNFAQVEKSV